MPPCNRRGNARGSRRARSTVITKCPSASSLAAWLWSPCFSATASWPGTGGCYEAADQSHRHQDGTRAVRLVLCVFRGGPRDAATAHYPGRGSLTLSVDGHTRPVASAHLPRSHSAIEAAEA